MNTNWRNGKLQNCKPPDWFCDCMQSSWYHYKMRPVCLNRAPGPACMLCQMHSARSSVQPCMQFRQSMIGHLLPAKNTPADCCFDLLQAADAAFQTGGHKPQQTVLQIMVTSKGLGVALALREWYTVDHKLLLMTPLAGNIGSVV